MFVFEKNLINLCRWTYINTSLKGKYITFECKKYVKVFLIKSRILKEFF